MLSLVGTGGAVFAAHTWVDRTTPDAFHGSVAVDVFPGRSLEAAIAVRSRTAVDAVFFIFVVHMKAVDAFGTTVTIRRRTAVRTF